MITNLIIAIYFAMFVNLLVRLYQETDAKLEITFIKGFLLGGTAQSIPAIDESGEVDEEVTINIFQVTFGFIIFTLTYLVEDK